MTTVGDLLDMVGYMLVRVSVVDGRHGRETKSNHIFIGNISVGNSR